MFGERERAAPLRARQREVDDRPHDAGGRHGRLHQGGAGALPQGAAADAERRGTSPRLQLERTPFYINTETRPWIHGDAAAIRAAPAINAFGFGGINAHVVLEEAPDAAADAPLRTAVGQRSVPPLGENRADDLVGLARQVVAGDRRAARRQAGRLAFTAQQRRAQASGRPPLPRHRRAFDRGSGAQARTGAAATRRSGVPEDQGRQRHLLLRGAAGAERKAGVPVSRRGRAVPQHAGRSVPALSGGSRLFRRDGSSVRRPSARLRAERPGVPAAGVFGRRAGGSRTSARGRWTWPSKPCTPPTMRCTPS